MITLRDAYVCANVSGKKYNPDLARKVLRQTVDEYQHRYKHINAQIAKIIYVEWPTKGDTLPDSVFSAIAGNSAKSLSRVV